jgi:hypothetical protein
MRTPLRRGASMVKEEEPLITEKHLPRTEKGRLQVQQLNTAVEVTQQKAKELDALSNDVITAGTTEAQSVVDATKQTQSIILDVSKELPTLRRFASERIFLILVLFVGLRAILYASFPFLGAVWTLADVTLLVLVTILVEGLLVPLGLTEEKKTLGRWTTETGELQSRSSSRLESWKDSLHEQFSRLQSWSHNIPRVARTFVPLLGSLFETVEQEHECLRTVETMKSLLTSLTFEPSETAALIQGFDTDLPIFQSILEIQDSYVQRLADRLGLPVVCVRLLFFDFTGSSQERNTAWEKVKHDKSMAIRLLDFLVARNLLPKTEFTNEQKFNIVAKSSQFSVQRLRWAHRNLLSVQAWFSSLVEAARQESLSSSDEGFRLNAFGSGVDLSVEQLSANAIYDLLEHAARQVLDASLRSRQEIACALLVIVAASRVYPMKTVACQRAAANNDCIDLLFSYIHMKTDPSKLSTLRDATTQEKSKLDELRTRWRPGWERLQATLKQGEWSDSLYYLLREALDKLKEDWGSFTETKEKLAAFRDVAANMLSLSTVAQILESRSVIAYLITVSSRLGEIMPRIDELLQSRDGIFWFAKYTDSTRIGIVPPGMTFSDFCQQFQKRLKIGEQWKANIIIQSFTLSSFNTFPLHFGEHFETPWTILRRLIGYHLDISTLRLYLRYGELIRDSFLDKPFFEVVADFIYSSRYREQFEELREKFNRCDIMKTICSELHVDGIRGFLDFVTHTEDPKFVKSVLKKAFKDKLALEDEELLNRLAEAVLKRFLSFSRIAPDLSIGI